MKIFLRPRNIKMSDGIAADQREFERSYECYGITSSQVRECVLNEQEITLNTRQIEAGFTEDVIKEKILEHV